MAQLQLAKVVNKHSEPFRGKYDNQQYLIAPGSETVVPMDAVRNWLGNPDAADLDDKRRDRTEEFRRIRAKYGVYEYDERMEENFPRLEVYTLEGERIYTVIDDPEGKNVARNIRDAQPQDVNAQVAMLQQQINALTALIQSQGGRSPFPVGEDEDDGLEGDDSETDDGEGGPPAFTSDDPRRVLT